MDGARRPPDVTTTKAELRLRVACLKRFCVGSANVEVAEAATCLRRCQRALVFTPCAGHTPTDQTLYGADRSLFEAVNLMLCSYIRFHTQ